MSTVEQQNEQQRVSGQVTSVITKGPDRWQVAVQPAGSQYTKNLWTKDAALVNDLSQRIGIHLDFLCGVSHWTNQQGQPVRSLWINSVGAFNSIPEPAAQQTVYQQPQPQQHGGWQQTYQPPTTLPVQPQTPPQQQPALQQPAGMTAQPIPPEVKEMRIMRQTAMKVAAALLPYLPPEQRNLSGLQIVAEWQVRYYTGGPQDQPWQEPQQQNGPQQQPVQYTEAHQAVEHYGPQDPGPQEGQYDSMAGVQPGSEEAWQAYQGGFPQ